MEKIQNIITLNGLLRFLQQYFFNGNKNVQVGSIFLTQWPPGSGSGIQAHGSADSYTKEIFTDAHYCLLHREKNTKREESEEAIIALLADLETIEGWSQFQ
jgi:hypothetical protein